MSDSSDHSEAIGAGAGPSSGPDSEPFLGSTVIPQDLSQRLLDKHHATGREHPRSGSGIFSANKLKVWDFAGWGSERELTVPPEELERVETNLSTPHSKLGEWSATAICGNDILSSCLYVSQLVTVKAGRLAPICLAIVSAILYLFRSIYGEAVTALPMNGGGYNVLVNTTSKTVASFCACLAMLSYVATGVISGTAAINYLSSLWADVPIVGATIVLLLAFAILCTLGISESAKVALLIFITHIGTLLTLMVFCTIYWVKHPHVMSDNWSTGYPDVNIAGTFHDGSLFTALFFGLGSAMLGISGFESSSQFVQEQKPGVFCKTLRNMWVGVAFFNPLISLLSFAVLPIEGKGGIIGADDDKLLAHMARVAGGHWLEVMVSIDALIVLSGAVLTAYVGITGLVRRLASDRVLPGILLRTNSWRGTNHYIIFGFFAVASSLLLMVDGDTSTLAGVYTFAFLGLLGLFSTGTILLKFKRPNLKRSVVASYSTVFTGLLMVVISFMSNLLGNPTILQYFAVYLLLVMFIMFCMFQRVRLLRLALYFAGRCCPSKPGGLTGVRGGRTLAESILRITGPTMVFFAKHDDLCLLNKAITYVRNNEQTRHLWILHVYDGEEGVPPRMAEHVDTLDRIYPKIRVDFVTIQGQFGPALITWLSESQNIPRNCMFIKCPQTHFAHSIDSLGGVRVITQ